MKVLLVEDDPTMRTTLQRALSRRGMQVDSCGDGGRALGRMAGRSRPTWWCWT